MRLAVGLCGVGVEDDLRVALLAVVEALIRVRRLLERQLLGDHEARLGAARDDQVTQVPVVGLHVHLARAHGLALLEELPAPIRSASASLLGHGRARQPRPSRASGGHLRRGETDGDRGVDVTARHRARCVHAECDAREPHERDRPQVEGHGAHRHGDGAVAEQEKMKVPTPSASDSASNVRGCSRCDMVTPLLRDGAWSNQVRCTTAPRGGRPGPGRATRSASLCEGSDRTTVGSAPDATSGELRVRAAPTQRSPEPAHR